TKIGVTVSSGSFSNIVSALGYTATVNSSSSFTITHTSGHLPIGNISPATFCVIGATLYTITMQYFYIDQNGIEQRCVFPQVFECPKIIPKCSCDSLITEINQLSSNPGVCCHNFTSQIGTSNCFTKIAVSVNSGSFVNIQTAINYFVSNQSNNSFNLTHISGHIPSGNITPANFCVTGATIYTITIQYYYIDQNGIEQRCIKTELFDCPKPVAYCNCDSLTTTINNLNNNPGLCCYNFTSNVKSANCFTKIAVSVNSGTFVNTLAAIGFTIGNQSNNSFSLTHSSGHIPSGNITPANLCVSGATVYTITIQYYYLDQNGIEQRCIKSATFDCPPPNQACNCDSIKTNITQTSTNPGICCHAIQSFIPKPNCMFAMSVQISAGTLSNVIPATNFTIGNLTNTHFNVGHTSGFLPLGNSQPVTFCVSGATIYSITIKYFYFNVGKLDSCVFSKSFDCPELDTSKLCDHGLCLGARAWQNISSFPGIVYDMKTYKCKLYAAGQFTTFANQSINNIAQWNGTNWAPLSSGVNGIVRTLAVHNGLLYVGGHFTMAGNVAVNNLAAWDGSNWFDVGGGVTNTNPAPAVLALLSTSNGLVVAGQFGQLGNNTIVNNIAMWNGSWTTPYGQGLPYPINMLNVYMNDLYAGGAFFNAPYNNISRWNGSSWNALSPNGITLINNVLYNGVNSSYVWNSELLIGGHFRKAENILNTQHIVRWNGANWLSMIEGDVQDSIAAINDFIKYNGELFVGGEYNQIGNTSALGVARSSNSNWFTVGHNNKLCKALETYDSCGAISCDLYSAGEGFVSRWVCVTSTLNSDRAINWNIYPNPANNEITVDLKESGFKNFQLVIKDIQGQVVYSKIYLDDSLIQLDVSGLSEGIYFLEVVDYKKGSAQKKFVKSR
ncbi:MAG: T9SS type A sorting domain-containing protein, partial [Saprospiraceae bacterium]